MWMAVENFYPASLGGHFSDESSVILKNLLKFSRCFIFLSDVDNRRALRGMEQME